MASPASRSATRRRLPAAERRQRIVRAFIEETLACGSLGRVAVRRVAERAGCTPPILYRLFGDRAALVREAIRSTHAPLLARVESIVAGDGSAAARLRAFAERLLAQAPGEDERFEAIVFAECAHDPELADEVRGIFTRFEALLAGLIRRGIVAGEFRGDADPLYAAWRLIDIGLFRNQVRLMQLATPDAIGYGARALDSLLAEIAA
jgi:AcrR family transcriptional regulator